jgi:hypothetical protein
VVIDTRPRFDYVLPDGTSARVIFDHGETPPARITFTLAGGRVVWIPRATR